MRKNVKRLAGPERDLAKRAVQKKRKYVEGKEKQIKREGRRIPRKLEHKSKIDNFEAVDRIAKARRGRVHVPGAHKEKIKGQYFRTGLAREEILRQKPTKPRDHPKSKSKRVQERQRDTAINKPVEHPSTMADQTRDRRLTSTSQRPPPPSVKMRRKLGKIPIKSKEHPSRNYTEIRDKFELASGGRNVLQNKELITAHPEALQDENNRKNQKRVKPEAAQLDHEMEENGDGEDEEKTHDEKPKKILGVKLFGLGSKAEKTANKPALRSHHKNSKSPAKTNMRVNKLTRHAIQNSNAEQMDSDSPFMDDLTLVARRIRKVPGRNLKKHELVLEEIHELPPIRVRKKELDEMFPEKNPEKFVELRNKYRFLNSVVTARISLEKLVKFTKMVCLGLFQHIRSMFKESKIGNEDQANVTRK